LDKKTKSSSSVALTNEELCYPIGQALAPCLAVGCCAVNELVSRALFIGKISKIVFLRDFPHLTT